MLPFAAAAAWGSAFRVQKLIDNGCHLGENEFDDGASFRKECSSRALAWAAEIGYGKVVMQLLHNGADPDAEGGNELGQTKPPDEGHLRIVELLLDKGAEPNTGDEKYNATPFLTAIRLGHLEIVKFLFDNGAEPNVEGGLCPGEKALLVTIKEGHQEIAKLLLEKGAYPNSKDR